MTDRIADYGMIGDCEGAPLREMDRCVCRASIPIQIVVGIEGRVKMRSELVIRFDYGRAVPWISRLENGVLRAIAGPNMLLLSTPVSVRGKDMKTVGDFTVAAATGITDIAGCATRRSLCWR